MRIGDKVVCVENDWYPFGKGATDYSGMHPKKDGIYVINLIEDRAGDGFYLGLDGFSMVYKKEGFRPLHYDFAEEVIKNLLEQTIEVV